MLTTNIKNPLKNQEFIQLIINSVYVGQTNTNLETRKKEHFRNLSLNYIEKLALSSIFGTLDLNLTIQFVRGLNCYSGKDIYSLACTL